MQIIIRDEVKAFLSKKNSKVLTVSVIQSGGGWCGSLSIPEVGYRVPEVPEHYNIFHVDEITVYVKKNVNTTADRLEFVVNKILFVKSLDIKGVKTMSH